MKCLINNCDREIHAKKMCEMHYRRVLRGKDVGSNEPQREPRNFNTKSDEERFFDFVDKRGGCWIWNGAQTSAGYSQFQVNKRTVYGHRWSYKHFVGEIKKGLTVDHICRIRSCVNPKHLEAVTNKENILRGIAPSAINSRKTHCVHGHKLSSDNIYNNKNGHRVCKTCGQIRDRKRK